MTDKNAFWVGLLIGLALPVFVFLFLYGLDRLTGILSGPPAEMTIEKMMFVSAALNILPFRHYFSRKELRETGKGILFITVVMVVVIVFVFR